MTIKLPGYHITEIQKGIVGEYSKILEEAEEFADAEHQNCMIMQLVELSDLYGAIEAYLEKHCPSIVMSDLKTMSDITKRAFRNGRR